MVLLSAPIQAFRTALLGVRPFLQPASNLAMQILQRWSAPVPVRTNWHGRLNLARQVVAHGTIAQRVFRRLTERWNEKGERRSAFQPLSLPRGIAEAQSSWAPPAYEQEASPEIGSFALEVESEAGPGENAQASWVEMTRPEPGRLAGQEVEERRPPSSAHQLVSTEANLGREPVFARKPALQRTRPERERPEWPYRLVAPRREQAETGPSQPTARREAQAPVLRRPAAQNHEVPRPVSSLRRGEGLVPEARPMVQHQPLKPTARMPVSTVRMPSTIAAQRAELNEAEADALMAPRELQTVPRGLRDRSLAIPDLDRAPESAAPVGARVAVSRRTLRTMKRPGGHTSSQAAVEGIPLLQPAQAMPNMGREMPGRAEVTDLEATSSPTLEQEWPLFGVLGSLTRAPVTGESTALQILRRMWPEAENRESVQRMHEAVQASSSLGPGVPLAPELRRGMETMLGRGLGEARLHTNPLAQTLRAEAFTSGRHIVFAPGRWEPGTPQGLALLGHELTHLGQPLAFKQESPVGGVGEDSQELTARTQEERILQVFEKGWPEAPGREYQHPRRASTTTPVAGGITMVQRAVEIEEITSQVTQTEQPAGGETTAGQASPSQSDAGQSGATQGGASAGPGAGGGQSASLDALARQVYALLKDRLRAERERHSLYR